MYIFRWIINSSHSCGQIGQEYTHTSNGLTNKNRIDADGQCVVKSGNRCIEGEQGVFTEYYYLPPGQYQIVFYNIEF